MRASPPPRLRFFLGAFGEPGHAFPMLALGAQLVARGHDVTLETWSRWREHVESNGMRFVAAPEYSVLASGGRPLRPYEAALRSTPATRQAISELAHHLVAHDILTLAPALAGELQGLPVATLVPHIYPSAASGAPPYSLGARLPRTAVGAMLWRSLRGAVKPGLRRGRDELNATRIRLGLPPTARLHGGLSERLTIVGTFPALEYPRVLPGGVHVVGPLMWEPPYHDVPPPDGNTPLVVVAPSTAQDREQRLLRAAVIGLAREPVRVLATWNRRPPPTPLMPSPNTHLVEWISYTRTMSEASLVVCHAGHGTMARALACGSPVLCVPHLGDMAENAARADWAGVGVRLPWRMLSPVTLRLAVRRALAEPSLAARAGELRRWASANDGALRAAELVEGLALNRGGEPAHAR